MSRLTKFLKQTAVVQKVKRDSKGNPVLDSYGDPEYDPRIHKVKCRKERDTKDVLTTGGSAVISTTRYFLDNSIDVDIGDLIDGKPILTAVDFVNAVGYSEGWEVTV